MRGEVIEHFPVGEVHEANMGIERRNEDRLRVLRRDERGDGFLYVNKLVRRRFRFRTLKIRTTKVIGAKLPLSQVVGANMAVHRAGHDVGAANVDGLDGVPSFVKRLNSLSVLRTEWDQ